MSVRFDQRQLEYTMTHRIGAGGMSEACQRPESIRSIATRLMGWRAAPETCQNCHSLPAVSLRAAIPLCSRCRENRDAFLGTLAKEPAGRSPVVTRADDDTSTDQQLRGHSIVFNKKSVDMGFFEIIRPRAADRLMSEKPDLRALWNHDSSIPLARYSAGTLRYEKVTRGVAVEIDPPATSAGRDAVVLVDRRDVTGQSFGFYALEDDWHLEEGAAVREIFDMEVIEVSIVSFPAYPDTDIKVVNAGARSAWQIERSTRERLRLAR